MAAPRNSQCDTNLLSCTFESYEFVSNSSADPHFLDVETVTCNPFLAKRDYTLCLDNGLANPSVRRLSVVGVHPTQGV